MILIYIASGVSAGAFMGRYVNNDWIKKGSLDPNGQLALLIEKFAREGFTWRRVIWHHYLYWLGLLVGLLGLFGAIISKSVSAHC
jgi:hypothetical protein